MVWQIVKEFIFFITNIFSNCKNLLQHKNVVLYRFAFAHVMAHAQLEPNVAKVTCALNPVQVQPSAPAENSASQEVAA